MAALQVALSSRGLYGGTIDGDFTPATVAALRTFQRRVGLVPDGILGPQTRAALGTYGRFDLGSRTLGRGMSGWDVAAAQFLLAWHGFPSGTFDGEFGERTQRATLRFQRWAGLPSAGSIGSATLAALQAPPAHIHLALTWPLALPVTELFGPRGTRFHTGIDIPAPSGRVVAAAAAGTVIATGWAADWGYSVLLAHAEGVRTFYAHLSAIDVRVGAAVLAGAPIGHVGSTGHSTGPHLHFEVRLGEAAVDPIPALPARG